MNLTVDVVIRLITKFTEYDTVGIDLRHADTKTRFAD